MVDVETAYARSVFIGIEMEREEVSETAVPRDGRLAWIRNLRIAVIVKYHRHTRWKRYLAVKRLLPTLLPRLSWKTADEPTLDGLRFDDDGTLRWLNGDTEHTVSFRPSA